MANRGRRKRERREAQQQQAQRQPPETPRLGVIMQDDIGDPRVVRTIKGDEVPIPKPSVVFTTADETQPGQFTPEIIRGFTMNPLYAGIGLVPATVPEEQWIRVNAQLIRQEGPEQYVVNMLHMVRELIRNLEEAGAYCFGPPPEPTDASP